MIVVKLVDLLKIEVSNYMTLNAIQTRRFNLLCLLHDCSVQLCTHPCRGARRRWRCIVMAEFNMRLNIFMTKCLRRGGGGRGSALGEGVWAEWSHWVEKLFATDRWKSCSLEDVRRTASAEGFCGRPHVHGGQQTLRHDICEAYTRR